MSRGWQLHVSTIFFQNSSLVIKPVILGLHPSCCLHCHALNICINILYEHLLMHIFASTNIPQNNFCQNIWEWSLLFFRKSNFYLKIMLCVRIYSLNAINSGIYKCIVFSLSLKQIIFKSWRVKSSTEVLAFLADFIQK